MYSYDGKRLATVANWDAQDSKIEKLEVGDKSYDLSGYTFASGTVVRITDLTEIIDSGSGGEGSGGDDEYTLAVDQTDTLKITDSGGFDLLRIVDESENAVDFAKVAFNLNEENNLEISYDNKLRFTITDWDDEDYRIEELKIGDDTYHLGGYEKGTSLADLGKVIREADTDGTFAGTQGEDLLIGTADDDMLEGGEGADNLAGGEGADDLSGGAGDDTLEGGAGNDTLAGNSGNDRFEGGMGDDTYVYESGTDTLLDAGGSDTLELSALMASNMNVSLIEGDNGEKDLLLQSTITPEDSILIKNWSVAENKIEFVKVDDKLLNLIVGTEEDDPSLQGTTEDDLIFGLRGNDTLEGGVGNDTLAGGEGADNLFGGVGDDTLEGGAGNDTLAGNDGVDHLDGGAGDDDLSGNAGDDTLEGGEGADKLFGNAGNDTLGGADKGNDTLLGGEDNDDLSGGAGKDTLDRLAGNSGNDHLEGGIGDDTYVYESGNDTLLDTGGSDTLELSALMASNMNVSLIEGDNGEKDLLLQSTTIADNSILIKNWSVAENKIEFVKVGDKLLNLIVGTEEDDLSLQGTQGDDLIFGLRGNDHLEGGEGNDHLEGGEGNDTLEGNSGNDTLVGGMGDDTYVYESGTDTLLDAGGSDTLELSALMASTIDASTIDASLVDVTGGKIEFVKVGDRDNGEKDLLLQSITTPDNSILIKDWSVAENKIEFVKVGDRLLNYNSR